MLSLGKTLTDWITWTNTTVKDDWNTWEEWQRHQLHSHYEKSDIFHYYLSRRPQFSPPKQSCLNGYQSKYYIYCFGDFTSLLVNPYGGGDVTEYFSLLLDVYDICKGRSRMITGDPNGITLLRKVIAHRNLEPLKNFDFNKISYPYNIIHAHTVAQYSLSTLIMRLVGHYMSQTNANGYYPNIATASCKQAYDICIFGTPVSILKGEPGSNSNSKSVSVPISIQARPPNLDDIKGGSWPRDKSTCLRCKSCNRVTENVWGIFDACLDCHLKRICSMCSSPAVIISTDNLPKCSLHSLPQPNTSVPQPNISVPQPNISIPQPNISIPQPDISDHPAITVKLDE